MKNLLLLVTLLLSNILLKAQDVKTLGNLEASNTTVYVNLAQGKEVADANGDWDIAFNRTTVLVNSGSSGKGKAQGQVVSNTKFDALKKAPTSGFKSDTEKDKAIPAGSGNGWYEYDMGDHSINPIEDRVIVVKTTSGKVAKVQIQSYYHPTSHQSGVYTIRYAFL